jgi:hypothetical protein
VMVNNEKKKELNNKEKKYRSVAHISHTYLFLLAVEEKRGVQASPVCVSHAIDRLDRSSQSIKRAAAAQAAGIHSVDAAASDKE